MWVVKTIALFVAAFIVGLVVFSVAMFFAAIALGASMNEAAEFESYAWLPSLVAAFWVVRWRYVRRSQP